MTDFLREEANISARGVVIISHLVISIAGPEKFKMERTGKQSTKGSCSGYPSDGQNAAFRAAYNTNDIAMQFMQTQPAVQWSIQLYMSDFFKGLAYWMGSYPVEERLSKDAKEAQEAVMFVDVGGGFGYEAAALRKQHLEFPGRFFVQGHSFVTSEIKQDDVEAMTHEFFTPQPVKGARVCYLLLILHVWNDE